jgi:hypothetical protein
MSKDTRPVYMGTFERFQKETKTNFEAMDYNQRALAKRIGLIEKKQNLTSNSLRGVFWVSVIICTATLVYLLYS